ncbi:MAG: TolB family protein [Candidatus Krumholzibacteriia bacterium]
MGNFFRTRYLAWVAALSVVTVCSCKAIANKGLGKKHDPERFGIYTCTLDGKNLKQLITDPSRELNHARVSPDKTSITFTRYNHKGPNRLAEEKGGNYFNTELMLMNMDGSGLVSLIPARKKIVAANGYWTPDGKGIIHISNNNPKKKVQVMYLDVTTRKTRRVPTPERLFTADPHQVGNQIVFPGIAKKNELLSIWIMNADGSNARKISSPPPKKTQGKKAAVPVGDYDPKLSPDGTKVTFMRHLTKLSWHIIVVDLKTGKEADLTKHDGVDGVPEWSSDGRLLIFWHIDPKNIGNSGLYTMRPDGSGRKKIPLPAGYRYTMPAFFPGEGSDSNTRIIFSAKKDRTFQ